MPSNMGDQGSASYKHAMDVGKILLNALGELKDIRRSLNAESESVETSFQLDNVLSMAEHSLRDKAEQLSEVIMRQEDEEQGGTLVTKKRGAAHSPRRMTQRDHVGRHHGARGADASRYLEKPTSEQGRDYLEKELGVAKASTGTNARSAGKLGGESQPVERGKSAITYKAGTIIPKHIREDPYAAPPPLQEDDIRHGVFNLINRGLLPDHVDMTATLAHGGSVVNVGGTTLHHPSESRNRMDIATGAGLGYNIANVRLDLLPQKSANSPRDASAPNSKRALIKVNVDSGGLLAPDEDLLGSPLAPNKPPLPPNGGKDPSEAGANLGSPENSNTEGATKYEDLLDTYSLHEFLIRRGQTLTNTPEYDSYKRAYQDMWGDIQGLIDELENICGMYAVPLAVVDGKKLAQISQMKKNQRASYKLPTAVLLEAVSNIDAVAKLVEQPGRKFYGNKGQEEAARTIQKHARGFGVRQKSKNAVLAQKYIIPIQRWYRNCILRKKRKEALAKKKASDRIRFQDLQSQFIKDWDTIQEGPRVLIHLPSISSPDPERRFSMSHYQMRQNSQMARLCALSDPLVDVIYVSPYELPEDIAGYYDKLLQVGGVGEPDQRYRIIVPENHNRLPDHLSLTRILYCSPYAIKRIQAIVKGRPAYIVPSHIGEEELALAVKLNMPILGAHPDQSHSLASKSSARAIFKDAEVNVPPGVEIPVGGRQVSSNPLTVQYEIEAMDNPDQAEDILATLATLVVEHPDVPRWILKLDDEHGGRGHAWIDIGTIRSLEPVLDRLKQLQRPPPLARQREAVGAVEAGLRRSMPRRVGIAAAALYPSWIEFSAAMVNKGGVIEACPAMVTGSPSVNLLIAPTGAVSVLSTHEQIFCPAYRFIGASFPQSSVPHAALAQAAEVIGTCCYKGGIIGHIGIDFVALKESGMLRLWAVDLNIRYTATQASFDMFNFVCGGKFDPTAGTYLVPEIIEEEEEAQTESDLASQQLQDENMSVVDEGSVTTDDTGSVAAPRSRPVNNKVVDVGERSEVESVNSNISRGSLSVVKKLRSEDGSLLDSQWERRFYVMNDFVSHSNLPSIQYAAFFNRCRLDGVCFDMQERVGTAFNLMDSFASGVLGILCVGHSPQEAFRELAMALDFISRQVGPSDTDDTPIALEKHNFRSVHSTMKYLADKLSSHAPRPLK